MSATASRFPVASTIPFWIDGTELVSTSTFGVVSPMTGKKLYDCSSASTSDVEKAALAAQSAFPSWSRTSPSTKRDIFLRAADVFERRADEFNEYTRTEMGVGAELLEAHKAVVANLIRTVAGDAYQLQGTIHDVDDTSQTHIVQKVPYGVVLAIAPWNVPIILAARATLQPLMAGNTVILKGPELAPACVWAWGSMFKEAGLPDGCLNTLYHRPEDAPHITEAIIAHPLVRKLNFTGSSSVGAKIASVAGSHLKPCVLELGGKSPIIVLEDADIPLAAVQIAVSAFFNSGQACVSAERVIAHKSIAAQLMAALGSAVEAVFSTEAMQLVNEKAYEHTKSLVDEAIARGAKAVYGEAPTQIAGTTMKPVILGGVSDQMRIFLTESFGPSLATFEIESDEEAIKLANDSPYGLSASVFTQDLRRGLRISRALEFGHVHVNKGTLALDSSLPMTATKASGYGALGGKEGLAEWLRTKVVTYDN